MNSVYKNRYIGPTLDALGVTGAKDYAITRTLCSFFGKKCIVSDDFFTTQIE